MGSLVVDAPEAAQEGEAVQAFVRPHDIKLAKTAEGSDTGTGRGDRLKPVGGYVKVLLRMPSGDDFSVEVPRAEFDALGVVEGDRVHADVRMAKVFVGDFSI